MKIITSPNLFLYPFDPSHTEFLTDWVADKRSLLEFGGPDLKLPLTTEQLLTPSTSELRGRERRLYSVSSRVVGMLAGHGEILDIDTKKGTGRMARVLLAPMFRGEGLGHELIALLCTAAFDIVGLQSVTLRVFEDNAAAIACYEKAGFTWTDADACTVKVGRKNILSREMELRHEYWKTCKPDWANALRQGEDCCSH